MSVIAMHWAWQGAMLEPNPTKAWADLRVFLSGAFGVQLFFVISGFILALPFARATLEHRSRPALAHCYTRRLTRLEPPYILNLIVFLFVYVLIQKRGSFLEVTPEFLASMTYTHGLFYGGETVPNVETLAQVARRVDHALRHGLPLRAGEVIGHGQQPGEQIECPREDRHFLDRHRGPPSKHRTDWYADYG